MTLAKRWWAGLVFSAIALLVLQASRLLGGADFDWRDLSFEAILVATVLLMARASRLHWLDPAHWRLPWSGVAVIGLGLLASAAYVIDHVTLAAWIGLAALYIVLLEADQVLTFNRRAWLAGCIHVALALTAGAVPVAVAEVESRFSDEEFFVAVQALELAVFWLVLWMAWRRLPPVKARGQQSGVALPLRWLGPFLLLIAGAGLVFTLRSYQTSFFPAEAPSYDGISVREPFLCGQASPDSRTFDGRDVFRRLLARVQANPLKGTPEYGMLALGSGDRYWAEEFRSSLLREVAMAAFTGPANSVKSSQYDAALRVYYFSRVRTAFSNLFTVSDEALIRQWFAAINRRALTVEWVDWMYALAFSKLPEGPYENQENGAGLLALLESTGLAAPDLSPSNKSYLARNERGWVTRFRNTDDTFIYQPEWITNAFFQASFTGSIAENNARQSFEWILLQALSDGSPLRYNHPDAASLAGIAYLGARLLQDDRFIWLSERALSDVESRGQYLYAQPGVEQAVELVGHSPTQGTCLVYGNSGLPDQPGPLAPDKIVFRDSWSDDASYLLLNLRFTGWHRYKATNTITFLSQHGSLVGDELDGLPTNWLPIGRSLFRDKRIPRENLSGLLIPRTGMSAVLKTLTGVGGPWAQDPPFYARVLQFETGAERDVSTTELQDWHGWRESKTVYFYHSGPIIVEDTAQGPAGQSAALAWHVAGKAESQGQRLVLRGNDAEMVVLPLEPGQAKLELLQSTSSSNTQALYTSTMGGQLGALTVFLTKEWLGAQVELVQQGEHSVLQIAPAGKQAPLTLVLDGELKGNDLGR